MFKRNLSVVLVVLVLVSSLVVVKVNAVPEELNMDRIKSEADKADRSLLANAERRAVSERRALYNPTDAAPAPGP